MHNAKINGWLLIDKPEGISSVQALNNIKRTICNISGFEKYDTRFKIGHAGTLDPFASGLLLVALGEATKLISYAMCKSKSYDFTIKWGMSTDTLDYTGNIISQSASIPSLQAVQKAVDAIGVGIIQQIPPIFSAIHVNGKRAYKLARTGAMVSILSREALLKKLTILDHSNGQTLFRLDCGKGFYVRALARDIAALLYVDGHVSYLRRTAIEKFLLTDAIRLASLSNLLHNATQQDCLSQLICPLHAVLDDILVVRVSGGEERLLKMGQGILIPALTGGSEVVVCNAETGAVIAICKTTEGMLLPRRVFNL